MKTTRVLLLLTVVITASVASQKQGDARLIHRLTKRQTGRRYEPIPLTQQARYPDHSAAAASQSADVVGNPSSSGQTAEGVSGGSDPTSTSNSGRPYYRYVPAISTSSRQTVANRRDRYAGRRTASDGGSRGSTYTYPFSGSRQGFEAAVAGGVHTPSRSSASLGEQTYSAPSSSSSSSSSGTQQGLGTSVREEDTEPLVELLGQEETVEATPQATPSPRQRQIDRLRQQRGRRIQSRRQGTVYQATPYSGQGTYTSGNTRQRLTARLQPLPGRYSTGQTVGGRYNFNGQTGYTGQGQNGYNGNSGQGQYVPVFNGQQPFYSGNQGGGYNGGRGGQGQNSPVTFALNQGGLGADEYDQECPNTGVRININGHPCEAAVDLYGPHLCYRHEYTSRECCRKCMGLKNTNRVGCEFGDHSARCAALNPYDCYDLRNQRSCCESCQRMRQSGARAGCEYGDMTPNCERVRQNPGLCYIPENRHLCCATCNSIQNTADSECPWGNQNAELCQAWDGAGNVRINCYAAPIRRICCQACRRLQDWIPLDQPGCEYGDKPVTFNTNQYRNLNCTAFMRVYGGEQCTLNPTVNTNCCYTCHRYTQG